MNNREIKFKIKLEGFEGPVKDLLKGIRENRRDINQVPLVEIINQFEEFLLKNKGFIDVNLAGEAITDLSMLLKLKSDQVLPKPKSKEEEGEDNQEEEQEEKERVLENKDIYLKEYHLYQKIVKYLEQRKFYQADIYFPFSKGENKENKVEIQGVDLTDLLVALEKVLKNKKKEEFIAIKKRTFTVATKMEEILERLKYRKEGISFDCFMENTSNKLEIIVIFLALLELIYLKKITCHQEENFGEIIFYSR